jgi:hypothetical protein
MNIMRLLRRFGIPSCHRPAPTGVAPASLAALSLGAAGLGALISLSVPGSALAAPDRAASAALPGKIGAAVATASPSSATPGSTVEFEVTCASITASSATLSGATLGLPSQIPMTRTSDNGIFNVTVRLPRSIRPGSFHPDIDCSDGSSAPAALQVTALPGPGGAQTGDGSTSTQTNSALTEAGLAMIAAGAVTGGVALRRRGSGTRQ